MQWFIIQWCKSLFVQGHWSGARWTFRNNLHQTVSLLTQVCLTDSLLTQVCLTVSLLTQVCLTVSLLTNVCLTVSLLTNVCLTVSLLTNVCLTVSLLTVRQTWVSLLTLWWRMFSSFHNESCTRSVFRCSSWFYFGMSLERHGRMWTLLDHSMRVSATIFDFLRVLIPKDQKMVL